jgi:hypothetical protein
MQLSPDGENMIADVRYPYNYQGEYKNNYLFIGDKKGNIQTIDLGKTYLCGIAIDNTGEYAYYTSENELYFNGHQYEKSYQKVTSFAFEDGKLHIIGENDRGEKQEELISLNPNADAIIAEKKEQEKAEADQRNIQEFLKEKGITSAEQLSAIFGNAESIGSYQNQQQELQTQQQELERKLEEKDLAIKELQENLEKAEIENNSLTKENKELSTTLETIKNGIKKWRF